MSARLNIDLVGRVQKILIHRASENHKTNINRGFRLIASNKIQTTLVQRSTGNHVIVHDRKNVGS